MSEIQYLCWYLKERRHHLDERGKEEGRWRDCQRQERLNQEWGAHVWGAAESEVGQTTWPKTWPRQVAEAPVPWLIAPRSERRNSGRLVGGTSCVYSRVFLSLRQLRGAVKWAAEFWGRELRRRALGWESSNVGNWSNVCGWDGLEWEGKAQDNKAVILKGKVGWVCKGDREGAKLLYKWNLLNFSFNN